uniref:Uncharacterized protein n=1 Tax=Rhabditophanes sp. KR3021 TaxID=114890 RepID=A0AC35TX76_9BILA
MIGLMNVPCESPAEYYAAPRKSSSIAISTNTPTISSHSIHTNTTQLNLHTKSLSQELPLFEEKKESNKVRYLKDGRRVLNGQSLKIQTGPKLWEQLLMRSLVHKMEDEIQSPVDQINSLQNEFDSMNLLNKDRQMSQSTFSLVSDDRIVSACRTCNPVKRFKLCKRQLSKSAHSLNSPDNI